MTGAGSSRRAYDLRLAAIDEAARRAAVVRWVSVWVPGSDLASVGHALCGGGFVTRLELADGEAAALLRGLYATGLPPSGVALVPVPARPADDGDRDLAPFLAGNGRFVPIWNWRAFAFGPLWYLKKGLYGKGLVLLALTVVPIWGLAVTFTVSMAVLTYCGLAGSWDYYLWRVKRRQWW